MPYNVPVVYRLTSATIHIRLIYWLWTFGLQFYFIMTISGVGRGERGRHIPRSGILRGKKNFRSGKLQAEEKEKVSHSSMLPLTKVQIHERYMKDTLAANDLFCLSEFFQVMNTIFCHGQCQPTLCHWQWHSQDFFLKGGFVFKKNFDKKKKDCHMPITTDLHR